MAGFPPYPPAPQPECSAPTPINSAYSKIQCTLTGFPYAINSIPFKVVLPPTLTKNTLVVQRHGYTPYPITCTNLDGSSPNEIVIQVCASYWPDQRAYGMNPVLMNWAGPFLGHNYEGYVAAAAIEYVATHYGNRVAWERGITVRGRSEGATFGVLQSLAMPEPWRSMITVVDANAPHTMFTKKPNGQYWYDSAVRAAWGGADISPFDVEQAFAAGKADGITYRIRGGSNDRLGLIDLDFFRLCDKYHVQAFGTWDLGGHSESGEAGVNLPRTLYSGPDSYARLDVPTPVFTESTANNWGERGHYNMGLEWRAASITETRDRISAQIRYRQHTNLGTGIDNQPDEATFTFSFTRARYLKTGDIVNYRLNENAGSALVTKDGEITIQYLTLKTSTQYSTLEIWK